MPTVPDYPKEDWMQQLGQKNGSRQRFTIPKLPQKEWDEWLQGPTEGPRLRYRKDNSLDKAIDEHPDGFLVDDNHPGLDKLRDRLEIFQIPGEGEGGPLFARPKPKEGAPVA